MESPGDRQCDHVRAGSAGCGLESLERLPKWARDSLQAHDSDPRTAVYDWERLARGKTGDVLWDAAQHALLIHGELHNNLRMTWGRALLNWTRSPEQALRVMIDLNHRYALDGNDPNSYGGLLCCLGLFDRPFSPERPVFGAVRTRSSAAHAQRLDLSRYRQRIRSRGVGRPKSVAVVADWAATRLGESKREIAQTLLGHSFDAAALAPRAPVHLDAQRWSYARPDREVQKGCIWHNEHAVALCGDWCSGGRVEGAFLSGVAAAGRIAGTTIEINC